MTKANEVAATTTNEVAKKDVFDLSATFAEMGFAGTEFQREDTDLSGLDELKVFVKIPFAKFFAKTHSGYKSGSLVLFYGTDQEVVYELRKQPLDGIQILNIAYQRAAFEGQWSKTNSNNEPFCKSYDNKVGAEGGRYAGQACATCPAASWDEARKEGGPNATPPCKQVIMLLIRVPGHESPFHLQLKGINLKPFKEFGAELKKVVDANKTFSFLFQLTAYAELTEHANGENDIIKFKSMTPPVITKEQFDASKETFEWYRDEYLDMMKEASMSHALERADEATDVANSNSPF